MLFIFVLSIFHYEIAIALLTNTIMPIVLADGTHFYSTFEYSPGKFQRGQHS